jgi:putative hemolysin
MIELLVALGLILLNGVFAMSELAIVSSRKSRLKSMADNDVSGARAALRLAEEPGRFLSTVQIGITLVGILAGAFSGAVLSERLDAVFEQQGLPTRLAEPLAYALVIGTITYLSIVVGELVPKQLALRNAERAACLVAPLMELLSKLAAPLVWLLQVSARFIFGLFGQRQQTDNQVTDEEIRSLVAEAESAGVIEPEEKRMIAGVMRLADRPIRGLMTPRTEVAYLDVAADEATARALLRSTAHSRLPVVDGHPDNVIGVVQTRAILLDLLSGEPLDLRARLQKAPVVPDTLAAMDVLEALRESAVPMALVHDEYGHFEGIVTPTDALLAITGDYRAEAPEGDTEEPAAVRREDGSWLISGWMAVDEMAETLPLPLPEAPRDYQTAAGFLLAQFKRFPACGDIIEVSGWRFEVLDLDGRRIDKLLATRAERAPRIARAGSTLTAPAPRLP